MNKETFMRLARASFIPKKDDFLLRDEINAHCTKVFAAVYKKIEWDVEDTWQHGITPKMPNIPTLDEIYELAWQSYPEKENS